MRNDRKKMQLVTVAICVIVAAILFVVAMVLAQWSGDLLAMTGVSEARAGYIAEIVSGIIAAIAAVLVVVQLRDSETERIRQNDIEEASFLLQYNQAFIQDPNMAEVESLLEEQAFYNRTGEILSADNRQKFVNYLVYLEGLAPLVLRGVLQLDHIDNLMAYRFFIAVNNKEIQDKELKKFAGDYRGIFKLYKIWNSYRRERGYEIHLEKNRLDSWEEFSKYAE